MLSTIEQRHAARELHGINVASDTRAALDRAIATEVASGAELVSQAGTNALLVTGNKFNFTLNLLLTVLTAGLWLIVWAILVATNKPQRVVLFVNERGHVERRDTTATGSALAP